jgi:hypothetical protein
MRLITADLGWYPTQFVYELAKVRPERAIKFFGIYMNHLRVYLNPGYDIDELYDVFKAAVETAFNTPPPGP